MPVHNRDVAALFTKYATLLEIEGANPFRIRAYRNAARTIEGLPQSLAALIDEGKDLSELPSIGEDLAAKIEEIIATGGFSALAEMEARMPGELADIAALPGLGPKRVKALHDALGIKTIDDLEAAASAGKVRKLSGFGAKTEAKILEEIARRQESGQRLKFAIAEEIGEPLLAYLQSLRAVKEAVIAGSYRRRKETVGDLDILVTSDKPAEVMKRFVGYDDVKRVVSKGRTRSTVILRNGFQVDLRVVGEESFGAALYYFTGSKAHNIAVRAIAIKKGYKLNEYGLFKGKKRVAGRTEKGIFSKVGLPFIEPELRENRGEIEAGRKRKLPKLVGMDEIRGDLHVHTKASDGRASIEEMAKAAKECGYDYLAITDHTKHLKIAHGLDAKRLRKQMAAIDRLNGELKGITLLKSAEVDILSNGKLDLPDDLLGELDLVVGAVHYDFSLSAAKQTERIIRAMDHPSFNILAHPSCRLIGERPACALDMERLMEAAVERGCFMEVNGQPERLDLTDSHCLLAKEMGLKLAIATDAHSTATLGYMRYGVAQARRGWLEADDILNTRRWKDLKKLLKR